MPAVQLKLGPADHDTELTLEEFDTADYVPGFKYELIEGRLYVSPSPNLAENMLERWLRNKLESYADKNPDVIQYVATRGRVFLPVRSRPSTPEPDLALYAEIPAEISRDTKWDELDPIIVAEILVEGDIWKELSRNPKLYLKVPSIREYWVLDGSVDPARPTLIQFRRVGKKWVRMPYPFRSKFTTKLLPGFSLVIDPRK
jgi:Uma2 family endonuclease